MSLTFEYKNEKLVVDELIFDPALNNDIVVRIGTDYYLIRNLPTPNAIKESEIRKYKKTPYKDWRRGTSAWEFFINRLIPRDGYQVSVKRAATKEEFDAVCAEYNLTEDDISNAFIDSVGSLYGEEATKTFTSKQIRVPASAAIGLEGKLKEKGIQASNGSPGRVNIRIDFEEPPAPLVGVAEAAEILGWDKRKVSTYITRGSFPEPDQRLASGPIWTRKQIEDYRDSRKER